MTGTDLAVGGIVPTRFTPDPTGGRLVAWARSLHAAAQLGEALAATTFAPDHFRNKPTDCAAAILFGDEVGLTPMQSLQGVYVVKGRPGLSARTMVALVQARGHSVRLISSTDRKVVVAGKRYGTADEVIVEWTLERAQRAGYTGNAKYQSDPQSMLYARAASEVCRMIAADALAGLSYSIEELELDESAPVQATAQRADVDEPKPKRQRRSAPTPPEPELDGDTQTPDDGTGEAGDLAASEAPSSGPAVYTTHEQDTEMARLFDAFGVPVGERQAFVSEVVGRAITHPAVMTRSEADAVIVELRGLVGELG